MEKGTWRFENGTPHSSSLAAVHELSKEDGSELGTELLISERERHLTKKTLSMKSVEAKASFIAAEFPSPH